MIFIRGGPEQGSKPCDLGVRFVLAVPSNLMEVVTMAVRSSKTKTEGRGGHTGPTGPGPGREDTEV